MAHSEPALPPSSAGFTHLFPQIDIHSWRSSVSEGEPKGPWEWTHLGVLSLRRCWCSPTEASSLLSPDLLFRTRNSALKGSREEGGVLMRTEGEAAPAILMVRLLGKAGALGCHFKAFPAINQRLPPTHTHTPSSEGPAACAASRPPQRQNNGAIMTAVTPRFSQSLHLYLCIDSRLHTQVQLIYLTQRKAAEVEVEVSRPGAGAALLFAADAQRSELLPSIPFIFAAVKCATC